MYFFQPCLLTLLAFLAAHNDLLGLSKGQRRHYGILLVLVLVLSFAGEWKWENFTLFPATLALLAGTGIKAGKHWERILLSGLFGGVAAWKIGDTFPLVFEPALLSGLALGLFVLLYCKGVEERFCACAIGGIAYELGFCLQEYFLFSYCRWRLGSPVGLSISAMGLCTVLVGYLVKKGLMRNKQEKQAFFEPV